MAQVNVTVNGRSYTLGCDDGEEEHVLQLSRYIDTRLAELVAHVGQVGEARLLLMVSLLLSDELLNTQEQTSKLKGEVDQLRQSLLNWRADEDSVNRLIGRLEDIATQLENA
jgi:cell division protein ZapA